MHFNTLLVIILGLIYAQTSDVKSVVTDIYPGFGWDNLRFLDLSPIFDVSNFNTSDIYQSCIEIIPVRQNRIQLDSTVIDMFDVRTSDFAANMFIDNSVGFKGFKISGSFSLDYQSSKKLQGEEKTIALRNQIDYLVHDIILKSSCGLNPKVKQAIIDIARYQTSNQLTMATYTAQLFIKTYGTHFTSRLSLGGSIIQEDHIKQSLYHDERTDKKSYAAAAEASFLGSYGLSAKFGSSVTINDSTIYEARKNFTRKKIITKGGKFSLTDEPIQNWQPSIDSSPAIIRRGIENITFIIQSDKIPELSEVELENVRAELNRAVETYIQMNVYSGCMDRNSPSFNWIANVDDNSCVSAEENSQFGGFIRTCTEDSRMNQQCNKSRMNNYYTDTDECPPGFTRHLLYQSIQSEDLFRRHSYSCGHFGWRTCHETVFDGIGVRTLQFYGCNNNRNQPRSSDGVLKINNDYVFGGSFTNKKVNSVTGTQGCPDGPFKQVPVAGNSLTVCLAERVTDTDGLPHYGGIYSCNQGNIAFKEDTRECPQGFSAYVMDTIEDGCLLAVCLKFDKFPEIPELPSIALPPFISVPSRNQTNGVLNNSNSNVKTQITTTRNYLKAGLSIGGAGIGILIIVVVTIFFIQNKPQRWQSKRSNYVSLEETSPA